MPLELAESLLVLSHSIGIRNITIIGGEPTLWPHIIAFNKFCTGNKVKTTVATNAIRFGDDDFWERYIQHPNEAVGVSIKAHNVRLLKNATSSGHYQSMVKGLRRAFVQFRIGASTVYNRVCAEHLVDIASFAMDCGARSLGISPCTPVFYGGTSHNDYGVEPAEMVRHITSLYPRLEAVTQGRISFAMKLPFCFWPKDFIKMLINKGQITSSCQLRQRAGIVFDHDGSLAVCNSLTECSLGKYGVDFTDGDSLLAHLNSPLVAKLYDKVTSYPSPKCIGCKMYDACGGGCMMYWTHYNPQVCIPGWHE
jgi:radical SAM protein with 4Fe4S-binding SPASM domain